MGLIFFNFCDNDEIDIKIYSGSLNMIKLLKYLMFFKIFLISSLTVSMNVPPPPTPEEVTLNIFNVSSNASEHDKIRAWSHSFDRYQEMQTFTFDFGNSDWWLQAVFGPSDSDSVSSGIEDIASANNASSLELMQKQLTMIRKSLRQTKIPSNIQISINNNITFIIHEIKKATKHRHRPKNNIRPVSVDLEVLQRCLALTKLLI